MKAVPDGWLRRTGSIAFWALPVVAALSAWHAVRQLPSDVLSYRDWINGPLPSWRVPGPYPVVADAVWWPLRFVHVANVNPAWVLGWTGPATAIACVVLWRNASRPRAAVAVWLLAAAVLERSYWVRLEPLPALLTLVAVVQARRSRTALSALALSLGALVKVWPAFLLPLVLALQRRRPGRPFGWFAWFAVPWAALGAGIVLLQPLHATTWATFTLTRRIQIESVSALVPMWAMAAGSHVWRIHYESGLDSADLVFGPYLPAIHLLVELVVLVALTVLVARVVRWRRSAGAPSMASAGAPARSSAGAAARSSAGAAVRRTVELALCGQAVLLLLLILAGPVFSPQYLAWFAPVFAVAIGEGMLLREGAVWLAGCALTTLDYPYFFDDVRATAVRGLVVLTARDVVMAALLMLCWSRVWQLTRGGVAGQGEGEGTR